MKRYLGTQKEPYTQNIRWFSIEGQEEEGDKEGDTREVKIQTIAWDGFVLLLSGTSMHQQYQARIRPRVTGPPMHSWGVQSGQKYQGETNDLGTSPRVLEDKVDI